MAIIISQSGKNAQKLEQSKFEQEDHLQQYIYDNPESIPLYDIKEDIRLLILVREFGTQSGPIDALGVDADGSIYLIETKLYKNPDKRLVVAQVLDYGASLWKEGSNFNEFINSIDRGSQKFSKVSVNERIKDYFGFEDNEIETFWDNVKENLNDGIFKFVVLMDQLHKQLKNLIVFLNQNSQFDIYAVELEYYKHDQFEIMIPKLFGAEVKKDIAVSSAGAGARRTWTLESFWEDAKNRLSEKEFECIQKIYKFAEETADTITLGTGSSSGSFNPKYDNISVRSFFSVFSDGRIGLNIGYLDDHNQMKQFYDSLNHYLNIEVIKSMDENRLAQIYPKMPTKELVQNCDKFIEAIKDFIKKGTSSK